MSSSNKEMDSIIQTLSDMTVMQLLELSKKLETTWGVSATQAVAAQPVASSGSQQPAAAEKTTFSVLLASSGSNKIQVIKEVRAITNLSLADAKAMVDSAPKMVKENIDKAEAEAIKKQLETAGATVELK